MEDFWYGMEMEWKKIASMDNGKIVFHSIPYLALRRRGSEMDVSRLRDDFRDFFEKIAILTPFERHLHVLESFEKSNR